MQNLQNHFLIAMPNMTDPMFSRTVTLICEHNQEGAMGIIINRATLYCTKDLLAQAENANNNFAEAILHTGGPVQGERGFILHSNEGQWEQSLAVSEQLSLTSSSDILTALSQGKGPKQYFISLGYAGWGAGQLEQELAENAWLHDPASADILFDTPVEQRWTAAAQQLGIDIHLLDSNAGHA